MSRSGHELLIKLILVVGATLFGVLIVEGGMHFMGIDYAQVWEPDPELGWRHVPKARRLWTEEGNGLIEINSAGLRDRERPMEKPPGVFRIAIFGDSMTEAVQVNLNQTFSYLLEEKLRASGRHVEVMNFGVNGYSPIQELLYFKQQQSHYRPDLVIWAVYLDNDVSGCHPDLTVSQGGTPFLMPAEEGIHFDYSKAEQSFNEYHIEPIYTLREYSCLYRMLSAWSWQIKAQEEQAKTQANNKTPKRYLFYQTPLQPQWEEAWTIFEKVVIEFVTEAQRSSTKLIILSVPPSLLVDNNVWRNLLTSFPEMTGANWDLEGPELRLRTFAEKHHLTLLQPYPVYQQASKRPPLFWNDTGHFAPSGHQLMAEVLYDWLDKKGLLPGGEGNKIE